MVRRLVFLLFVLAVLAATAAGIYFLVPLVGDLSGKSLAHSLAREAETSTEIEGRGCQSRVSRRWTCRIPDGSATVTYRVRVRDRRCWTARRTSAGGGEGRAPPARLEGCVGLRDQVRVLDGLL